MPKQRAIYILHALGGKTTAARAGLGLDSDDAKDPETEQTLKHLRGQGRWTEHNAIWHKQIKRWADAHPGATLLVHSYEDAVAADDTATKTFLFPSEDVYWQRVRDAIAEGKVRRVQLSLNNRVKNLIAASLHRKATRTAIYDGGPLPSTATHLPG